jgi:CRISPR-associated endonuclease Csn1
MFSQRNNPYCDSLQIVQQTYTKLLNIKLMTKRILGLDLGTNSIGWALIEQDFDKKEGNIIGIGTRVIPMSQEILGDFGKGNSVSQTAERTSFRSTRRLRERNLLRRERLHRILNILGFLPTHYAQQIDFTKRFGKFIQEAEPKLVYNNREFIFMNSFNEMLAEFKQHQPALLVKQDGSPALIPYDWTLYYLRKKALTEKIEKEELAWIILNFNQKRGYYQLRGEEEEETPNKLVEFHSMRVTDVQADAPQKGKADIWYSIILENGWIYRRASKTPLFDWKDKVRDFIVTTDLNDDGTIKKDKEGNEKRSFRAPGEDDWTLLKKKTEQEIDKSRKSVGTFIYDALIQNPKQKIKGKLVRTIERKFYKDELNQILRKQQEFHPELRDEGILNQCARELYRYNDTHQSTLSKKDMAHLLVEDIIFYQRPLRSQKSTISNCPLEKRIYKDTDNNKLTQTLKVIPKSNPYYQEFRLWQWMFNLSIYRNDDEKNITSEVLDSVEKRQELFAFLNNRKEVDQKALLKHLKLSDKNYRWNYVEDKKYPCNETKALISNRLDKVENIDSTWLTREREQQLWHIIYSVTDKNEYEAALKTFAAKNNLDSASFVAAFKKFPPFKSEYGAFSEKAIKRLLPLMRIGSYWSWEAIDEKTKNRIEKIINAEYDENIKDRVREKAIALTEQQHFSGLPLWLAQYVVYNRHSEAADASKWKSVHDLEQYLEDFKQHSLRNPIVEQVITETLRVVKDIWTKYGKGVENYFDEIHIELGREMKNTADERKRMTSQISENENTNLRIKALLAEMATYSEVENVRPYSPMQQEILKVYEDGVLNSGIAIDDDYLKISKTAQPTPSELRRYKLWLEQKYRSPYTGEIIPLNKLFTHAYEIEHIIPQSRFFDDGMSNKIICEAEVNSLKDNMLGYEFIKKHHGTTLEIGTDKKVVRILEPEAYEDFVKQFYAKNRTKRNKLLMEEIPEKMIERQLNDTRYISKYITGVLSSIVRADANDDGHNSKNVLPGNGKITSTLKQDWGLNDVWNELILPRFERLNQLHNTTHFTAWSAQHQKYIPTVPIELSKNFSKKRIDHRHHALDALVIACATRDHINLLNNQSAKSDMKRYDLQYKLRERETYYNEKEKREKERFTKFFKPWNTFIVDSRMALEKIIVSFKQNLRVINKATNFYESYKDENGNLRRDKNGVLKKEKIKQNGTNWAIRKPMHKDTVSGLVSLRKQKTVSLSSAIDNVHHIVDKALKAEINRLIALGNDKKKITKYFKDLNNVYNDKDVSRVDIYYFETDMVASRVALNDTFDENRIKNTITDTGIQMILLNHLNNYKGILDEKGKEIPAHQLAFSPEGIEDLNKNIVALNNGKPHQPIFKFRTYEPKGNKFVIGHKDNKKHKFVEAAKGTNLFFAIYVDDKGKRSYETIPLNLVIERQKQGLSSVPDVNDAGQKLLMTLSPNDLVYIPIADEMTIIETINFNNLNKEQIERMYSVNDFSSTCYFSPNRIAKAIMAKEVDSNFDKTKNKLSGSFDIKTASLDGVQIKDVCIKLKIDRLGNIYRDQ